RRLAKSISDAGWATFRRWVEHYGRVHSIPVMAVPPQYTSQVCSGCGDLVRKSLSVRAHVCARCGLVLDRDHNAARNILAAALAALGGAGGPRGQVIGLRCQAHRTPRAVPWGTREPNAWGQPGSCGPPRGAPLPRLAEPRISRF